MYFLWEYVEVCWRGRWWPAEIVSETSEEGISGNNHYDIVYLGDWQQNHETNVAVKRIRKSNAAIPSSTAIFTPGTPVRIAWSSDSVFYLATIKGYDTGTGEHTVEYEDDLVVETLDLRKEIFQITPPLLNLISVSSKRKSGSSLPLTVKKRARASNVHAYTSLLSCPPGTVVWAQPTSAGVCWWPAVVCTDTLFRSSSCWKKHIVKWHTEQMNDCGDGILVWYFGSKNFGFVDPKSSQCNLILWKEGLERFKNGMVIPSLFIHRKCTRCKKLPRLMLSKCKEKQCTQKGNMLLCEKCVLVDKYRCCSGISEIVKRTASSSASSSSSSSSLSSSSSSSSSPMTTFESAVAEACYCEATDISERAMSNRRISPVNGMLMKTTAVSEIQELNSQENTSNKAKTTTTKAEAAEICCEVCQSGLDDANMLLCDTCSTGWHVYCLPIGLPDKFSLKTSDFLCPCCQKSNGEENIIDIRCCHSQSKQQQIAAPSPSLTLSSSSSSSSSSSPSPSPSSSSSSPSIW